MPSSAVAFAAALVFFVSFAQLVVARLAQEGYGLSPLAAEAAVAVFFLAGVAGCLRAGACLDRAPPAERRLPRRIGGAFMALGALSLAVGHLGSAAAFALALVAVGALLGSQVPPLMLWLRRDHPPEDLGAAFGLVTALTYAGANGLELLRHAPALTAGVLGLALLALGPWVASRPGRREDPGWRETRPLPRRNVALLALVVAADALGFSLVMNGSLARFTFQGPAHLGFNAAVHALGALVGALAFTPARARRLLLVGLGLMAASHLSFLLLGRGEAAGYLWTLQNGFGVALYHVPFFACLSYGPGEALGVRFSRTLCGAGWLAAGVGIGAGRLGLLLADPTTLLPAAGLVCLLVLLALGGGWRRHGFGPA